VAKSKRINSRQKGAAGEREFANFLKERGYDARRGQQFSGGTDSPDVIGVPGVHIEVKRTERTDIYGWLQQAKEDAGILNMPLVAHRKNGYGWVAIMDMEEFLMLLRQREKANAQS
jgi:Holliday junction resolvase